MIVFDFKTTTDISNWNIVDDVVMGGRSNGTFSLSNEGKGVFKGKVSLENNGGFSMVQYNFETKKLGDIAHFRFKGRTFLLLKPNTYMNLSGKAVKYWLEKESIPHENLLIITDDLNLPFGTLRLKTKGSAGGHNGLKDVQDKLNTSQYNRLRFGISDEFTKGKQVDYVLGNWTDEESETLKERLEHCSEFIKSFVMAGVQNAMNTFNGT